jgi:hypothetical protein
MKRITILLALIVHTAVLPVRAAFIIEPVDPAGAEIGLAFANFYYLPNTGTNSFATTAALGNGSDAVGLSFVGNNYNIFGGNGASDEYVFQYTLGTDADNATIAAGTDLGNGVLASGLTGGASGLYNVYATWPTSSNIDPLGSDFWLLNTSSLAEEFRVNDVVQDSDTAGTVPGNEVWWFVGSANLTAGTTYELHVLANNPSFVSQRISGVMFETAPIPEPSTYALALLGGLGLAFIVNRQRRK